MLSLNRIGELLKAFYTVTGIKIVVYDAHFCEMAAYPERDCDLCKKAKQLPGNPCGRSAEEFCKKAQSLRNLYVGKCHRGLVESVFPIIDEGMIKGYIMFGQIYPGDGQEPETFRTGDSPVHKTTEEIDACTTILKALCRYSLVSSMDKLRPREPGIIIGEYIKANLSEDLSCEALCRRFSWSKSKLYSITRPYMPRGIGAFVREQRMEEAKRLLADTDFSVYDISLMTGYGDVSYFLRSFRKYVGMSAGEFRMCYK